MRLAGAHASRIATSPLMLVPTKVWMRCWLSTYCSTACACRQRFQRAGLVVALIVLWAENQSAAAAEGLRQVFTQQALALPMTLSGAVQEEGLQLLRRTQRVADQSFIVDGKFEAPLHHSSVLLRRRSCVGALA